MTPPRSLKVLLVEDSAADADLVRRQLQLAGFSVRTSRVDNAEALTSALRHGRWDVVIADHRMPRFDSFAAFRVVQQEAPDVPVIVVSGAMHEKIAVDLIIQGVQDFVPKDNMARLGAAVERSMAHSRRVRELREQLAAASALDSVALLSAVINADVVAGVGRLGNAVDELRQAAGLPESDPRRGLARAAADEIQQALAPLRALAVTADDDSAPADVLAILRSSEAVLRTMAGPDVRLSLPEAGPVFQTSTSSGDVLRVLISLLIHAASRTHHGGEVAVHVGALEQGEPLSGDDPTLVVPWPCVRLSVTDQGRPLDEIQLALMMEAELDERTVSMSEPVIQLAVLVRTVGGILTTAARAGGGVDWLVALPSA